MDSPPPPHTSGRRSSSILSAATSPRPRWTCWSSTAVTSCSASAPARRRRWTSGRSTAAASICSATCRFGLTAHESRERLDLVLAALADGTMRIPVDGTLALDEVGAAFDALADRAVIGKIVLALDS